MIPSPDPRQADLQVILENSPVGGVLPAIAQLGLPNWWLAGGAVRNTVWRSRFSNCELGIKDFDIAFFDAEGDRQQELDAKAILTEQYPHHLFDVKNQASFARWRSGRQFYNSTEEGIGDWLHTATAVGVRMEADAWQFFTPYGLEDLFAGVVRPTPTHVGDPIAEQKGDSFLQKCPGLRRA